MKVGRMVSLALVFWITFIFCGMASADGGGGGQTTPNQCRNLPDPTDPEALRKINNLSGFVLHGIFMASLDRTGVYYHVYLLLQGETGWSRYYVPTNITHLFEQEVGPIPSDSLSNICDYTEIQLMKLYRWIPCALSVQDPFGMKGIPILTELSICKKKDFCEDRKKATIYGTVKIKVVPLGSF